MVKLCVQYLELLCLCFLSLEGLLAVAFDHDEGQEGADYSTADQNEDDRNTNGPDTRREERLRGVRRVDKGLRDNVRRRSGVKVENERQCTISRVQMV
jgi:hypothetical protein